jgi:sterol desaturase/sphingolipid hydroxylase (fatty acid hydroxylase superfamily)
MPLIEYTQECLDAAQGKWPASGGSSSEPNRKKAERPKRIRVFQNSFLEKVLGQAHPVTPIIWFGPPVLWGLYYGIHRAGLLTSLSIFLGGWLVWTLMEYLLHRFLFHWTGDTVEQKFRHFMLHGYHHEFPSDPMRLVAPPLMSWPLAIVVGGLYYIVLPDLHAWPMFAGTAAGYIAYDWIHYFTHHFRPRGRIGKFLKSYHLLHHFDEHHGHGRYGVSSPLWDLVFGTYHPVRSPKKNPHVSNA